MYRSRRNASPRTGDYHRAATGHLLQHFRIVVRELGNGPWEEFVAVGVEVIDELCGSVDCGRMESEAAQFLHELATFLRPQFRKGHEEDTRETGAEERPVDSIQGLVVRRVHVLAARTVELERALVWDVGIAGGENWLMLALGPRTRAVYPALVFSQLLPTRFAPYYYDFLHAARCEDEAGVYEAVQCRGVAPNLLLALVPIRVIYGT